MQAEGKGDHVVWIGKKYNRGGMSPAGIHHKNKYIAHIVGGSSLFCLVEFGEQCRQSHTSSFGNFGIAVAFNHRQDRVH